MQYFAMTFQLCLPKIIPFLFLAFWLWIVHFSRTDTLLSILVAFPFNKLATFILEIAKLAVGFWQSISKKM